MQWGKSKITAVPLPWPLQEREAFFYFFIYLWWWWGFLDWVLFFQRREVKKKKARHDLTSKNTAIHFCDSTKAKASWFSRDGAPRQRPCLTVAVDGLITTILQMIKEKARLFFVCASVPHLRRTSHTEPCRIQGATTMSCIVLKHCSTLKVDLTEGWKAVRHNCSWQGLRR